MMLLVPCFLLMVTNLVEQKVSSKTLKVCEKKRVSLYHSQFHYFQHVPTNQITQMICNASSILGQFFWSSSQKELTNRAWWTKCCQPVGMGRSKDTTKKFIQIANYESYHLHINWCNVDFCLSTRGHYINPNNALLWLGSPLSTVMIHNSTTFNRLDLRPTCRW